MKGNSTKTRHDVTNGGEWRDITDDDAPQTKAPAVATAPSVFKPNLTQRLMFTFYKTPYNKQLVKILERKDTSQFINQCLALP